MCNFYSRPCGRGDEIYGEIVRDADGFLLTPLREGRLYGDMLVGTISSISTHAPAGGATHECGNEDVEIVLISTHAPAGGATDQHPPGVVREDHISTHAPAGGATIAKTSSPYLKRISTHAPAGGATSSKFSPQRGHLFLLTPLREGRQLVAKLAAPSVNFYSRPCGRGDGTVSFCLR